MQRRRDLLAALTAAGPAAALGRPVFANLWPNRHISIIVPYPPGGSTDVTARIVGERLSAVLGQRLVIDNRPGAGGNLGMELIARAVAMVTRSASTPPRTPST